MKKLVTLFLSVSMLVGFTGCASSSSTAATSTASSTSETTKTYKVAIVKQLDHASLDEIASAICEELDVISERDGVTIEYGEVYSGQNDQTTLQQIATQVISDGVDVIIPIATLAAQTMTVASDGDVPIVFAAISDSESAELTDISYVTGTSDALNTEQIMDMILTANPDTKTVGLLYSMSEANSEKPIAEAKAYLDEKGISYIEATGNTDDEIRQAATSLIASNVDAVFTPTDNVVMAAELSIAQEFVEAGIPHYTGADSFVRNGAFATCGVNYTDLGHETADLAYKTITEGIEATGYAGSYEVMQGGIITVNKDASSELGISSDIFSEYGTVIEVETSED